MGRGRHILADETKFLTVVTEERVRNANMRSELQMYSVYETEQN